MPTLTRSPPVGTPETPGGRLPVYRAHDPAGPGRRCRERVRACSEAGSTGSTFLLRAEVPASQALADRLIRAWYVGMLVLWTWGATGARAASP